MCVEVPGCAPLGEYSRLLGGEAMSDSLPSARANAREPVSWDCLLGSRRWVKYNKSLPEEILVLYDVAVVSEYGTSRYRVKRSEKVSLYRKDEVVILLVPPIVEESSFRRARPKW